MVSILLFAIGITTFDEEDVEDDYITTKDNEDVEDDSIVDVNDEEVLG